jgi:hypothetical protein
MQEDDIWHFFEGFLALLSGGFVEKFCSLSPGPVTLLKYVITKGEFWRDYLSLL